MSDSKVTMHVPNLLSAAIVLLFATFPLTAHADLMGTSVTGSLNFNGGGTNFFSPATTTIGPGVEFFYSDPANTDFADFTGSGLTVSDTCTLDAVSCSFTSSWTMQFTDVAFTGLTLTNLTNNLNLTYSLAGDTLTLDYAGGAPMNLSATSTFSLVGASSPVPEPSTLALLGTGVLGVLQCTHRRIRRR